VLPSVQATPVISLRRPLGMQETNDLLVGHEGKVRLVLDVRQQVPFGIRLVGADRSEAVEVLGLVLVLKHLLLQAERQGFRTPARIAAGNLVDQRLKLRFIVEAVDAEQLLGLLVIWLQLVIAERPGEALVRRVRLELVRAEAQQRRPVPFGLAADVVVFVRDEDPIVVVDPRVVVLEPTHLKDLLDGKGAAVARQTITSLQD